MHCSHYLQQHLPQSHQTLCYLLERTTSLDSDQECVTRHCPSSATSTVQRVSRALFRSWISPNSLVSFRSGCVWPLTLIQLFHLCPSRLLSPSSWRNDNTQQWSLYSPTFFFFKSKVLYIANCRNWKTSAPQKFNYICPALAPITATDIYPHLRENLE